MKNKHHPTKSKLLSWLLKRVDGIEHMRVLREGYFDITLEIRMTREKFETELAPFIRDFEEFEWNNAIWVQLEELELWGEKGLSVRSGEGTYIYHVRFYKVKWEDL